MTTAPLHPLNRDRLKASDSLAALASWFESLSPAVVRGGKHSFETFPIVLAANRERKYLFLYGRKDSAQHVYSATVRKLISVRSLVIHKERLKLLLRTGGRVVATVHVDIALTMYGVVQKEHVLYAMTYAARERSHVVLRCTPSWTENSNPHSPHPWKRTVYMSCGTRANGSEIRVGIPTLDMLKVKAALRGDAAGSPPEVKNTEGSKSETKTKVDAPKRSIVPNIRKPTVERTKVVLSCAPAPLSKDGRCATSQANALGLTLAASTAVC